MVWDSLHRELFPVPCSPAVFADFPYISDLRLKVLVSDSVVEQGKAINKLSVLLTILQPIGMPIGMPFAVDPRPSGGG